MPSSTAAVKEWVASSHRTCDKGSSRNSPAYTRIPIWYRSVGKRACSASFLEEFFSETQFPAYGLLGNSVNSLGVLRACSVRVRLKLFGMLAYAEDLSDDSLW